MDRLRGCNSDGSGEGVLVNTSIRGVHSVTGEPVVRPDGMDHRWASGDTYVVSHEHLSVVRRIRSIDQFRVERNACHSYTRRKGHPSIYRTGIEQVQRVKS